MRLNFFTFYHQGGPGEKPGAATNLTLTQEAGGWVLRWVGPKEDTAKDIIYYTIEYTEDPQVWDFTKQQLISQILPQLF